jgi:hypothetical protein
METQGAERKMKEIKEMNAVELKAFYRNRIAQHSPARNHHDRTMLMVYQYYLERVGLLKRLN